MRLIAIILSFYTISLSALPCDDTMGFDNYEITSISQDSDNHSHNLFDLCSPFCICICCTAVVLERSNQPDFLISEISIREVSTHFNTSLLPNYIFKIYQPPKI